MWNLTRADTGERLDSGGDTFYVAGNSDRVHTVYPETDYIGNVRITFILYYGTERAGAYEDFTTEEETTTTTTTTTTISGGGGGGGGAAPSVPIPHVTERIYGLEIINYPDEVEIEKGWIGYVRIEINNTGNTELHDVGISIEEINSSWVEIPESIDVLIAGKIANFTLKFSVPKDAKSGNYEGYFVVKSDKAMDKKQFILRIFSSEYELVYYKIQTLKSRLKRLDDRMIQKEKEGNDVTTVKSILDNARTEIAVAEEYLDSKMYDKAKYKVRDVSNLLDRAEIELELVKPKKIPYFEFPSYTFKIIMVILVFILILVIYTILKITHVSIKIKHIKPKEISLSEIKNIITLKETMRELSEERERILKNIGLLEREYKEGIISKGSYKELKKRSIERLNEIDKKLKIPEEKSENNE